MNYAFDENNSIGVKYTLKANPDARYHTIFNSDVYTDGTHYDYLANDINATAYYNPSHSVNVYYKGMAGKRRLILMRIICLTKTETIRYNVKKAVIRKIGLSLLPIH